MALVNISNWQVCEKKSDNSNPINFADDQLVSNNQENVQDRCAYYLDDRFVSSWTKITDQALCQKQCDNSNAISFKYAKVSTSCRFDGKVFQTLLVSNNQDRCEHYIDGVKIASWTDINNRSQCYSQCKDNHKININNIKRSSMCRFDGIYMASNMSFSPEIFN
jgi:hypothetical protein